MRGLEVPFVDQTVTKNLSPKPCSDPYSPNADKHSVETFGHSLWTLMYSAHSSTGHTCHRFSSMVKSSKCLCRLNAATGTSPSLEPRSRSVSTFLTNSLSWDGRSDHTKNRKVIPKTPTTAPHVTATARSFCG